MAGSPDVTVLLPAYNAAKWLGAALDSVLAQTLGAFELLVMDDGSTDATGRLLEGYRDPRIRIVREVNRGLVAVLNHGIDLAAGKYIARMDADDVAHPRRLERQVAFLEKHTDVGICGTWFRIRGGKRPSHVRTPTGHGAIAAMLFFRSAFGHPTVMFRRAFLQESALRYSAAARHAEDYDLWVRARQCTRLANLPEYLLEYRIHSGQTSAEHLAPQSDAADRIRLAQLLEMLPSATEAEKRLHLRCCDGYVFSTKMELLEARSWLDHLQDVNRTVAMFPQRAFDEALAGAWVHCCHRASLPPCEVFRIFAGRWYSPFGLEAFRRHFILASRVLIH